MSNKAIIVPLPNQKNSPSGSNPVRRRNKKSKPNKQQAAAMPNTMSKKSVPRSVPRSRGPSLQLNNRARFPNQEYGVAATRLFNIYKMNPYLSMLCQPKVMQIRFPDTYSRPTALYTSYQYFDVVGNNNVLNSAMDMGKFAFLIQPIISNPYAQSLSIVNDTVTVFNPGTQWGIPNFQTRASYVEYLDPNTSTMAGSYTGPALNPGGAGLIEQYRPIAMSAWFQCTASDLQNGGEVSTVLADGSTIDDYYTVNSNTFYQEYKALAEAQRAYTGKLKDGCYTFWKPFGTNDSSLRQPYRTANNADDTAESYNFPAIYISGISSSPGVTIGRIEVITVYEYTTTSRIVEVVDSPVAPGLIEHASTMLTDQSTSMANTEHQTWINELLGVLGGAAKGAAKVALPAILEGLLGML